MITPRPLRQPSRNQGRTARRPTLETLEDRRLPSRGMPDLAPALGTIRCEVALEELAARPVPGGRVATHSAGLVLVAKKVKTPTFPAGAQGAPDASGRVTIAGKVAPRAKVKVDVGADGSIDATAKADK